MRVPHERSHGARHHAQRTSHVCMVCPILKHNICAEAQPGHHALPTPSSCTSIRSSPCQQLPVPTAPRADLHTSRDSPNALTRLNPKPNRVTSSRYLCGGGGSPWQKSLSREQCSLQIRTQIISQNRRRVPGIGPAAFSDTRNPGYWSHG